MEHPLSISAGGVSWLVFQGACAGTGLLCCASHRAGRSLAQPRCRRPGRHSHRAWLSSNCMGGISSRMRPKIIAPGSCFSLRLLLRDMPSTKWTGLGPDPTEGDVFGHRLELLPRPLPVLWGLQLLQQLTMASFPWLGAEANSAFPSGNWEALALVLCPAVLVGGRTVCGCQFGNVPCPQ